MPPPEDLRWAQRLHNFKKACARLQEAADLAQARPLSQLERQGAVQAFVFTHELAWKTLKDFLEEQSPQTPLYGSKDATRAAFRLSLIADGQTWLDMIQMRNLSSHTYDESTAQTVVQAAFTDYLPQFAQLIQTLEALLPGNRQTS